MGYRITDTIKDNYFIESNKIWNIFIMNEMFPTCTVDKIISIHIPTNNVQNKVIWRFFLMEIYYQNSYLG